MKFFNRRFLTRQTFEIQKSSLKVERKHMFEAIEYEVPLDLVNNKRKVQTIVNNNLIMVGAFFGVFSFLFLLGEHNELTIIFFCIGIVFIVVAFFNRKRVVSIPLFDGNRLDLYFTDRNKEEVIAYADAVIQAADNYLLKKYSKIDRSLPVEPQLESLQFLLNREIITDENFETLKNQLLGKNGNGAIGFGKT